MNQLSQRTTWQLTECRDDGLAPQVFTLTKDVVCVGRVAEAGLCLRMGSVSKQHAELTVDADGLLVRDLGSTNGTFVNGARVQQARLKGDDLIQFANLLFRVDCSCAAEPTATIVEGAIPWAQALLQFVRLMDADGVIPHFQPIVRLDDGERIGFEMLARSNLDGLQNPGVMFATAAKLGQECALSEMLRREGVREAISAGYESNLFLNTHPHEVVTPRLIESLRELREITPSQAITIEIHEAAMTDRNMMRDFRSLLIELDMQLAYDDFGAGQTRLDELTLVPPDYLKFDISLIRDVDTAPAGRRNLIESLVRAVSNLGVTPLAEGIETPAEAAACLELGFTLAQGYYFGRPAPLSMRLTAMA
jgi:EAL domain-containing protein (putative c-di-GMP-specific phosphodiesterase class I)